MQPKKNDYKVASFRFMGVDMPPSTVVQAGVLLAGLGVGWGTMAVKLEGLGSSLAETQQEVAATPAKVATIETRQSQFKEDISHIKVTLGEIQSMLARISAKLDQLEHDHLEFKDSSTRERNRQAKR